MANPVFLIALGAIAGAVAGVVSGGGGGGLGSELIDRAADTAAAYWRMAPTLTPPPQRELATAGATHDVFSACLSQGGRNVERTLRDLLEFHEHDATLSLVECLLGGSPQRFCAPEGRQQAADAMEIYLWSRDDARRTSPAHGLADKIRQLDRATEAVAPDPFVYTWSGPRDRAVFDKLKSLVKDGYLEPGAFAFSGRAELREAVRDVKPEGGPCVGLARAD